MSESVTSTEDHGFTADQTALEVRAADLIRAMDRALESLPDPTAVRGAGRWLRLDKTLAWKATRIAAASDLADLLPVLPGIAGRRKLLNALAETADDEDVEHLRAAFRALDEEIATRRLDRATLASMAAGGLDSESQRREHRRTRETAMRAATRVFGSAAGVSICTHVLVGGDQPGTVEHRRLDASLGLHRTGPGPNLEIAVGSVLREDLSSRDAAAEIIEMPSTGATLFHGRDTSPSRRIDLVFASPPTIMSREDADDIALSTTIRVPSDAAILELLVDRGLGWPPPRGVLTEAQPLGACADPTQASPLRVRMSELLERDAALELGPTLKHARVRHADAIDRCLTELDRTPDEFVVHRVAVPHPVFMSRLSLLRGRPDSSVESFPGVRS